MATVSQKLKGTFSNARHSLEGFEKKAAKQDKGNLSDWLKDREGSGHNN